MDSMYGSESFSIETTINPWEQIRFFQAESEENEDDGNEHGENP